MDAPADQPEVEANASEHLVAEVGAQTEQGGDDDSSDSSARRDAERRERYTGIVAWRKLLTQRHGWKFITSMFEEKIISLSIHGADQ